MRSFTRQCDKPFDFGLMDAMEATARAMVAEMHGTVLAYHQSDEISVSRLARLLDVGAPDHDCPRTHGAKG